MSSILDEIKRNSVNGEYQSIKAEALSQERNRKSRKTNPLKNPKVYSYVYDKLRYGWTPQQIAGRLKRNNNNQTIICHETIYQYIYSLEGRTKQLSEYLVRKHTEKDDPGMVENCTLEEYHTE